MERPLISTVVLNWNRSHLLRITLESYLTTVSVPYELIVVDNASTDESRKIIEEVCRRDARHRFVFLKRNLGGKALNSGFRRARGSFVHVTENDIEYLPGWDADLLKKFAAFPELGQLSVFGPEPQSTRGEIWEKHEATPASRGDATIQVAEYIGTTALYRREIWDRGLRWSCLPTPHGRSFKLPNDFAASDYVRQLGYWVAWNDRYTVINWGHNVEEWQTHLDYYLGNYDAKVWIGHEGMRQRLRAHGFDLVKNHGRFEIVRP